MSQRAVPSSTTQPMFRDGDSNVVRCTMWSAAAVAELVALADVVEPEGVTTALVLDALVLDALPADVVAALDDAVTVTVFAPPLDPQPASPTSKATPANPTIALVTIESLYREQPTGRFHS
jgi:hypothetical protein